MTAPPTGDRIRQLPPAGDGPRRSPAGDRLRRLLLVTAVLAAVLLYLTWWQTYAGIHVLKRYTQLPPGQSGMQHGSPVRLLSLTRVDRLADSDGGESQAPDPGAVWVVAELETTVSGDPQDFPCEQTLLGGQRQVWESTSPRVQRAVGFCDNDKITAGQPYRFETVFEVPGVQENRLAGVVLSDPSTPHRTPVLTPPR